MHDCCDHAKIDEENVVKCYRCFRSTECVVGTRSLSHKSDSKFVTNK